MKEYIDFSYMDILLQPVGLSVLKDKNNCLYKALAPIIIGYLILILISEAIAMSLSFNDLHQVTINGCVMLIIAMSVCKAIGFLTMRNKLKELVTRLGEGFQTTGYAHETILKDASFHARFVTVLFAIMSGFLICIWNILPLVQNWYLSSKSANGTDDLQRNLPMIVWYPFDTEQYFVYTIIYILQVYGAISYSLVHIGADTFYVGYFIYISAHLKILCQLFKNVRENSLDNLKIRRLYLPSTKLNDKVRNPSVRCSNKTSSMQIDINNELIIGKEELDAEMEKNVVAFVKLHQDIIRFVKDLEAAISPVVLIQFFISALIICLSGFQATVTIDDQGMFLKFMVYMATAAFQLMLYCWYGQYLIDHGEAVQMAAYSCGWTDASPSFKRSLRIVILRAQRPLKLTAGKIYVMSLDTFVKLLNASYSFFAVLRQLNDS